MQDLRTNNKELVIKFNVEELTPTQVRLLKSVTSLLSHVLAADEESEFFETSSELMRKVAETIKHADFANKNKQMAYGDQAVEFAIDFLNDSMDANKVHNIDN
jgi:phosphatidate phosphatase PAH1